MRTQCQQHVFGVPHCQPPDCKVMLRNTYSQKPFLQSQLKSIKERLFCLLCHFVLGLDTHIYHWQTLGISCLKGDMGARKRPTLSGPAPVPGGTGASLPSPIIRGCSINHGLVHGPVPGSRDTCWALTETNKPFRFVIGDIRHSVLIEIGVDHLVQVIDCTT
jgi:hypothetical protein